jgi:hypothetical protein
MRWLRVLLLIAVIACSVVFDVTAGCPQGCTQMYAYTYAGSGTYLWEDDNEAVWDSCLVPNTVPVNHPPGFAIFTEQLNILPGKCNQDPANISLWRYNAKNCPDPCSTDSTPRELYNINPCQKDGTSRTSWLRYICKAS